MSYLDKTGLSHFFEKLKGVFAAKNHTHTKADIGLGNVDNVKQLPIAGGTMTGTLTLKGSQYNDAYGGALNANNSNIYGVNSIYTADASENASEGIHFYRDASHVDTLWMNGGDLLFTPNRALAGSSASTSKANSEKVARLPASVASGQFVMTDGTTGKLKTVGSALDPSLIGDGYTKSSFYVNTHPENSPTIIPFINNDIAFLLKRGGSAVVKKDGVVWNTDISSVFDGSPSYWANSASTMSGVKEITIELSLHRTFSYSNWIYIDFGNNGWRAKHIKIEVMNSSSSYQDVWTTNGEITNNALGEYKVSVSHKPVGAENTGGGFNMIRFTLSDFASTLFRIAQIGVINYGSAGLRETSMSRGIDDPVFRSITPNENNTYALGTSSKRWSNVYAQKGNFANGITGDVTGKVNGHTVNADVPSGAKFTDTTYTAATAAPVKVASASAQGTSTNYARQDHTHGIDVGTGDANGQVKIAGQNASVKGLAALAYKASLGKSDVGLGNVDNTSDTNKPVSIAQRKAIDDKVPLIISSQTTTTNHWTGEAPFASLEDGQTIRYHLVRDPTGTADLTLTLSGGTDTPAYPIYFNTFSRVTTHFAVGQIITMTFRTDVQRNATGTKYTGWFVNDYRDSDTVTKGMWDTSAAKVGSGNKVFGYSLFMEKADGTFESIALSGGTGTGKTKNSAGFRPGRIWYNESSAERASGAVLPYGTYYRQLDFRYSTNCAQTLTAQKPVYLVGEIIEGLFYIHDNNFIAQDLPTSEDGLAYMYLGGAYNTYCVALMPDHPIYIYQGGRIKRWLEGIRTINGVGAGEDGNIDLEVDDITGNLISGSKVVRSVNEISPDDSGNVNVHTGWHAYLVWENANPSATFAAQTISLNLSHFDWVLIEARHFEEGNTTGYSTMLCRKGQTTSLLVVSHSNNRDGTRAAIVTDTGVQFSVCTYNNATNNNYGVPLRIYAISGTEATIAELVKEYIFNNGSFAAPLVNSWGKVGNVATMTVTDGVITMKSTSTDTSTVTRPAYGYATTPIDLTNYKEFRARVKVKGKKGGAIGFSAAVPTSVANDVSSCGFAAYSQPTDSTATYEGWISVDISALSGNHYLGMWATGYHVSGSTSSPVGTVLIYEAYLIPNDE